MAARNAQQELHSPGTTKRRQAENEMPRVHGKSWMDAWFKTQSYARWAAEHSPEIATHSEPPPSPAATAAIHDGIRAGLLEVSPVEYSEPTESPLTYARTSGV